MKIFSIDSSNQKLSIALYDSEAARIIAENSALTKSSNLMSLIQGLFIEANLKPQDLDLLLCNLGPGSFTGIRTAVTLIKTIAAELGLKIFVTNNFELIRFENNLTSTQAVALKAGKHDYFISLDSDWHNPETNFYSIEFGTNPLYEFRAENLSRLMIKFYEEKKERTLIGYKDLEPYYLREPSIGVKKNAG